MDKEVEETNMTTEYLMDYDEPDSFQVQPELTNRHSTEGNEEHEDESTDDPLSEENAIFSCVLMAYKRQFKGQSSGSFVARWEVSASNTGGFIRKVWNLSKEHLNRAVVFLANEDGTTRPSWGPNETPVEEEFDNFVLFQSGRRHYTLDKVRESSGLLQNWRDKEITVLLHVYSLTISNRTVWNSVKEQLIDPAERDKSGAASTQAVVGLADEIRAMHSNHLEAHGMAWSFWANSILNAPAHLRESLKDHPPQHLAHLFRAKEGEHISAIRRELTVAHTVNNSFHEEIASMRQVYNVAESNLESLTVTMKTLKARLEALELRDKLSESMISAMETTVNVQEDELSRNLSAKVVDCEDVDHKFD